MKKILLILITFILFKPLNAAEQTVEMLNKSGKELMVYSKKVLNVSVGDTVLWKSVNPGHNVEFINGGVPDGVGKFRSPMSKDVQYTFKVPGIYAYWCTPHKTMGMIGFVVVDGNKSNLESIKKIKYLGKSKKVAAELLNTL